MKKVSIAIIGIIIAIVLIACSNQERPINYNNENAGMVNPVSDSSIKDIEKELGLKNIVFDSSISIDNVTKINGEIPIYNIEFDKNHKMYNTRICKHIEGMDEDISGVYLDGNVNNAIFDSSNADFAPSVSVAVSSNGSKAYSVWQGYCISLSSDKKEIVDEFQTLFNDIATTLVRSKLPVLCFKGDNTNKVNVIYNSDDFKIKVVGGTVQIIYSDMAYELGQSIEQQIIQSTDVYTIIDKCGIKGDMFKDGGSQVYNFDDFSAIIMNTLDGNKDIIIGPKDAELYNR